jgi:uncharacterized glyoxalase superfamily protein PhnB
MASNASRVPEGYHTLAPHLVVKGAAQAIDYYKKAFGATEIRRHPGPDGSSIMFAEVQIGDSRLFLNDEFPNMGVTSPLAMGGTPVTIHMYVEDADAVFTRAVDAGAKVLMPLADQFWGDRYGMVADPFGHRWSIASHLEDLTPDQLRQRAAKAFENPGCH